MTGWEKAGGCVLGGPWRLTEPCDVTVGGATWLDQAQETAARKNQSAGPHRKEDGGGGNRRAAPINQGMGGWEGGGQLPNRIGEATDSCRSTQGKKRSGGAEDRPPRAKNEKNEKKNKKTTMSTQVRGERDVGRGMGLQTGRAEAERIAMTELRSIYNLLMCD